jgi:pimeloyl-ACP methyl ester carboxylesterase
LIHFVKNTKANNISLSKLPVILVGHSFGAIISYLAACKRPDMFGAVILLDPPLITGPASWIFRFAKKNRLIDKITPAGKTKIRNTKWQHDTDLVAYFHSRALFKDMDKDCIKDYVEAVTHREGDHLHLHFDPVIETNIFRTLPDNLHLQYGKLTVPAHLLTGKFTKVCIPRLRNRFLRGNPEVQLERPLELAKELNEILGNIVSTLPKAK